MTLAEADVRAETGCTIIAIFRDGQTITDLDPNDVQVHADDEVVVVGTADDVTRFECQFGG